MDFAATTASLLRTPSLPDHFAASTSPRQGSVAQACWQHYSLLVYAIPTERVRHMVPEDFSLEEISITDPKTNLPGRFALFSVESYLDNGSGFLPSQGGSFEQMKFRLHVRRQGQSGMWLLGTSVGSLTAVAPRHLWSQPWHLSAMELQAAWNHAERRYQSYRLQSYSQWTNAAWQLKDTGQPLESGPDVAGLNDEWQQALRTSVEWYQRRDGLPGEYRTTRSELQFTRGQVSTARCDLLEQSDLITSGGLKEPLLAALQPQLTARIQAPIAAETSGVFRSLSTPESPNHFAISC